MPLFPALLLEDGWGQAGCLSPEEGERETLGCAEWAAKQKGEEEPGSPHNDMSLSGRENIALKDTCTRHHNTPFAQTRGSRESPYTQNGGGGRGKGVRKMKNRIKEKAREQTQVEINEKVLQTGE